MPLGSADVTLGIVVMAYMFLESMQKVLSNAARRRQAESFPRSLLRLSAGLEDANDLIHDLDQALRVLG